MIPPILEEIQRYTRDVDDKKIQCDVSSCPRCHKPASFTLHDRRRRSYFVIIERLVKTVLSRLTRWKCGRCGDTFTLYPRFALPKKRYLREEIVKRTGRYLEEDEESYRSAVTVEHMAVFHEGEGEEIDERSFSHTTLYRWIALFGSLRSTCRKALERIRQQAPSSEIFRKIPLPVAPRKYRSEERRRALAEARRLLLAEAEHRQLLGDSIFPRLATLCSWS